MILERLGGGLLPSAQRSLPFLTIHDPPRRRRYYRVVTVSIEVKELIRPQQRAAEAGPRFVGGQFLRGELLAELRMCL